MPDSVDVVCVQLPGRGARFGDTLLSDLSIVVEQLSFAIEDLLDLPYVFFGHSLGALIAHQLSAKLIGEGFRIPNHIVVSGRSAPGDKNVYYDKITHLPDEEILEKLPEYGGTPKELLENKELMKVCLPIIRSDFLLAENQQELSTKLPCPISVFGGTDDRISCENLQLWGEETSKECNVYMIPGGHFFISDRQDLVLKHLCSILQRFVPPTN